MGLELRLTAGSKTTQQFLLHASDYVSWICTEDFGYTIDFSVKLWARRQVWQRCVFIWEEREREREREREGLGEEERGRGGERVFFFPFFSMS